MSSKICGLVVLFTSVIVFSHGKQFVKDVWGYNFSKMFNGRVLESIVVARDVKDMVYISLSEERGNKKCSNWKRNEGQERVNCNPIVAKILLKGEAVVNWNTSLSDSKGNTRFTSLSISHDGERLYATGTLISVEGEDKFYVETIDTRDGVSTGVKYISELPGSQIVRSNAVSEGGLHFCGKSMKSRVAEESLGNDEEEEFLLGQISFSGTLLWRYKKKLLNVTCEAIDISEEFVYTVGTMRRGVTGGVIYKHSKEGDVVWGKRIRSSVDLPLRPFDVLATGDGVFMSSGFVGNYEPRERVMVQKVSERGNLLWTREIGIGDVVRGMGYYKGFVYGFVTRGVRGMIFGRVGRFGRGLDDVSVDDMSVDGDSGIGVRSGWAHNDTGLVVVSGDSGIQGYAVKMNGSDEIGDSKNGRYGYRIKAKMVVEEDDMESLRDYLCELTYSGKVWMKKSGKEIEVEMAVRNDDIARLDEIVERVKQAFKVGSDGRNDINVQSGLVAQLRGDVVVERVSDEVEGKRSNIGVVVGVVVGLVVSLLVLGGFVGCRGSRRWNFYV